MNKSAQSDQAGLLESLGRVWRGGMGLVRNRAELFAVELHEQEHRLVLLLLLTGSALLLGLLALILFTGAAIFLFPAPNRIYAAASLGVLYLLGAFLLLRRARAPLQEQPFAETINQLKKDVECLAPPT